MRRLKTTTRNTCPTESQEQIVLMHWWAMASNVLGLDERLLFHIPNGRQRSARDGKRLQLEGVRPGVPDLFLAVPSVQGFLGLWIELKRRVGGHVTQLQSGYHELLSQQGYAVSVCYGWEEARQRILQYLGKPMREVVI